MIEDLNLAFPQATELGSVLTASGLSVGFAESCTGGLLGAALTAVPGSSAYVRGGFAAYANDLKETLVGVPAGLLEQHGAVSAQTARALAQGARERCGADFGVGITGVAGPQASESRPAGLIYICVVGPRGAEISKLEGDHGRHANRCRAVAAALELLLEVAQPRSDG